MDDRVLPTYFGDLVVTGEKQYEFQPLSGIDPVWAHLQVSSVLSGAPDADTAARTLANNVVMWAQSQVPVYREGERVMPERERIVTFITNGLWLLTNSAVSPEVAHARAEAIASLSNFAEYVPAQVTSAEQQETAVA